MAELGWTGLLVPEKFGGLGLGLLDMALLLEEMGRAVVPGPFLFSSALATFALMRGGSSRPEKDLVAPGLPQATPSAPWLFSKPATA